MDKPCCVGVVRDSKGLAGTELADDGVKLYHSVPKSKNDTGMGIVVIHDIFGFALPNCKYIADHWASEGYEAVMPDFYEAHGINPWPATESEISKPLEGDAFGAWFGSITSASYWEKFDAQLATAVAFLKKKGCSKFAVFGMCWGGIAAERAAQTDVFTAAFSAHGCMHTAESWKKCKAKIMYVSVPDDAFFPKASQDELKAAGANIKIFEGMQHGFIVRGDFGGDSKAKAAADEAMADAAALFRSSVGMTKPCCVGVVRDSKGLAGTELAEDGVKLYHSVPKSKNDTGMGIVVIHDIFGFALPNCKYIADHWASQGYEAVMPDFYEAHGINPHPATESEITTPLGGDAFGAWFGSITSASYWEKFDAQLATAVAFLKKKGCSKFAVFGMCWGGIAAERAAQTDVFTAAFSAHGCMHTAESWKKCKAKIMYVSVPDDAFFPKASQDELKAAGANIKIFEGMQHGFIVRGDFGGDSKAKAAADEAMADAAALFRGSVGMTKPCCVGVVRDSAGLAGTEIKDKARKLKVYYTAPKSQNGTGMGIVLVHDIFGFALPNCKYIADNFASLGYETVMPDFYEEQLIEPWPATESDVSKPLEGDAFGAWFGSITSEAFWDAFDTQLSSAVAFLKKKGCTKFGVVGLCWGGIGAERAAQTDVFTAAVSAHGCMHTAESWKKCKAQIMYLSVPDDAFFAKANQDELKAAGANIKIFEGMGHGFIVRGDFGGDSKQKQAADEALADIDTLLQSASAAAGAQQEDK